MSPISLPKSGVPAMKSSTVSSDFLAWTFRARAAHRPSDPYAFHMGYRTKSGEPLIHMPALVDLARDDYPRVVIQKSAQVGISELLTSRAMWAAANKLAGRGNVLYVMPTRQQ